MIEAWLFDDDKECCPLDEYEVVKYPSDGAVIAFCRGSDETTWDFSAFFVGSGLLTILYPSFSQNKIFILRGALSSSSFRPFSEPTLPCSFKLDSDLDICDEPNRLLTLGIEFQVCFSSRFSFKNPHCPFSDENSAGLIGARFGDSNRNSC